MMVVNNEYSDAELDELLEGRVRGRGMSRDLLRAMTQGWSQPRFDEAQWAGMPPRVARRARIAAAVGDTGLIVPNGTLRRRSNDLHYPFRPGTDHMWLAGPTDAGSALVWLDGAWTLYVDQRPPLGDPMALLDGTRGAIWDGSPVPPEVLSRRLGLEVRPVEELAEAVAGREAHAVRGLDPSIDAITVDDGGEAERLLARMRLIKDPYEIEQLRDAVDAAVQGFEAIARHRAEVIKHGEAFVEGLFTQHARTRGRGLAYTPVVGGGANATVLHWFTNDGPIGSDDLLLLDAGVEGPELYSSDITRTLPVSGQYTVAQRDVYDVVHAAQAAALAAVRPGAPYAAAGVAAAEVLVAGLSDLGVLPHPALAHLDPLQAARRWSLHAIGHMLGADVHDSAVVADEYSEGTYAPGHCLTIEPGLYFSPHDQWAPEHLRGIGVRIEDDVLVTEDGIEVLSQALPSRAADVETWMGDLA
jgi:Xaa-Pro aminopeptidase